MKEQLINIGRRLTSKSTRRRIIHYTRWPPVGWVQFGSFRRLKPIGRFMGLERGQPIDRYYIDKFVSAQSNDIVGHVLEVGENLYTDRFGGEQVTQSDILHVAQQRAGVTIIGDLTNADHIQSSTFDCVILTQTIQCIFNVSAAIQTVYRILKPGGVVLATVPGISKISRYDMDRWGYYWSFTTMSIRCLFEEAFPANKIEVQAYGNVLASIAFLHGLASSELRQKELDYFDPDYELLITIRAQKPEA